MWFVLTPCINTFLRRCASGDMLASALQKHKLAFSYTDVNKMTAVSFCATWWLWRKVILLILINIVLAALVSLSKCLLEKLGLVRKRLLLSICKKKKGMFSEGAISRTHELWRLFRKSHKCELLLKHTWICSLQTFAAALFCDTPSGFTIYFAVPHFLACPKKVFSSLYQHFKSVWRWSEWEEKGEPWWDEEKGSDNC